jgi:hypothetical protein
VDSAYYLVRSMSVGADFADVIGSGYDLRPRGGSCGRLAQSSIWAAWQIDPTLRSASDRACAV